MTRISRSRVRHCPRRPAPKRQETRQRPKAQAIRVQPLPPPAKIIVGLGGQPLGLTVPSGRDEVAGPPQSMPPRVCVLGRVCLVLWRDCAAGGFGVGQSSAVRSARFQALFAVAWRKRGLSRAGRSGLSEVDGDDQLAGWAARYCAPGPPGYSGMASRS